MKLRIVTVGSIPLAMSRLQAQRKCIRLTILRIVGSNLADNAMWFLIINCNQ